MLVKHSTRPTQWAGVALAAAALLAFGMWRHEAPAPAPAPTAPVASSDRSFTELSSEQAAEASASAVDGTLTAPPFTPAR